MTENGLSIAGFSPLGASCTNLSLSGQTLISEMAPDAGQIFFGSVLAPWPNRLQDGWFELDGKRFEYPLDAQGNANHGLIGYRALEVRSHEESEIVFGYLFGDAEYPYEIDLEIRYSIGDSFRFEATAKNLGSVRAPFALGFHPYYRLKGKSHFLASVNHHVITDKRLIPKSVQRIEPLNLRFPSDLKLDDGYIGNWEVQFETEEFALFITQKNMQNLMLYTPPVSPFADGTPALAIEPMSGPTNAFQTELDKHLIEPGDSKQFSYEVRTLS